MTVLPPSTALIEKVGTTVLGGGAWVGGRGGLGAGRRCGGGNAGPGAVLFVPEPVVVIVAASQALEADRDLGATLERIGDIDGDLEGTALTGIEAGYFDAVFGFGVVFAHQDLEFEVFGHVLGQNGDCLVSLNISNGETGGVGS